MFQPYLEGIASLCTPEAAETVEASERRNAFAEGGLIVLDRVIV